MTKEERLDLKEKIHLTISKTKEDIIRLEEETKPISPENSIGRVSRMDAINNKSVAEVALRSSKRKLGALQHALTKIDSPEFGKCSRCGGKIRSARLMFMPESTQCVRCAAR
ncbi:MAG: TraR/DksA C4-type zinc finger protein [Bacteroidetes bacterium]|jgi:DnaK suppressor protein|nr:TraR/DksA C4-type zinc finger protein [Bacteroidota bacterium]MDF1863383.1 TraR/DksA C4-type zinc finger protein [Saprospiraceae bacterium]